MREAVEKHLISESRYTSYLNMLEDKEEGSIGRHTKEVIAIPKMKVPPHTL